jgi:hypothetical protein
MSERNDLSNIPKMTRPLGWPNDSASIRAQLWQQEMTELINTQTQVLTEIRDILREEQVTLSDMIGEGEYQGKHRRSHGQSQDKAEPE